MKLKNTRSTTQLSSDRSMLRKQTKVANGGYLLPVLKDCEKIELYHCGLHETVVALRVFGKKPKGITCPVCKKWASMTLQTTDPDHVKTPTLEWAQPPEKDLRYMPDAMRNYFLTGGLYLRTIPKNGKDAE